MRFIIMLLFFSASSFAYEEKKVVFTPFGGAGNGVSFHFNGEIYDEKYTYEYIKDRIAASKATPVEVTLYEFYEAFLNDDKDKILDLWQPKYRGSIKVMLDNPSDYQKNKAMFDNVMSSKLISVIEYGDYYICYVTHVLRGSGPFVKIYPMLKNIGGRPVMTNDLSSDLFFSSMSYQIATYIKDNYQ